MSDFSIALNPSSIKKFSNSVGITKRNSTIDVLRLENTLREELNKTSPRVFAVVDPVKVIINNYPEDKTETIEAVNNPENPDSGTREIIFSKELYIERNDFMEHPPRKFFRLSLGKEVRLKYAYFIKCVEVVKNSKNETVDYDKVLVSVGRKPYTEGLNLTKVGVKKDNKGRIEVNEKLQTSIKNIYAIGDVIKGPMLAHKAEEEGIAVAEILAGQAGHVNYDIIPGVIYTSPEVATVGKTEEQLKNENKVYKVGKFPFLANSRAKVNNETEGFVKILADSKTDKVLGVHIIGPHCGDMIAEMALAMEFGASAEDIARTCHAHPTHTEAIKEAALAVDKRPIHF